MTDINKTALPVQEIAPGVFVAPQMTPEAMELASSAGFKAIMNNRPDFEGGPSQPTSKSIETFALQAGLAYVHLPVQGGYQSPEDIALCAKWLQTLPRPLLMFCRSGARSTNLYHQAAALAQLPEA